MTSEVRDLSLGTADERRMLDGFLDYCRRAVVRKAAGLSEEAARRRLVASPTTVAAVVKHLRWVELAWFQRRLAGMPADRLPPPPYSDERPDGDFELGADETLAGLLADYEAECARSRETAARYTLDHAIPHPRLGHTSLRWIYAHMIEETARHAGHLDILREQIDGRTGD